MIQPVSSGPALIREVHRATPRPGTLAVWWLGQSGYLIKSTNGTLVIDPYLSEHLTTKYAATDKPHVRMTEAPLRGRELGDIDVAVSSHQHSDHLDPGTMPDLMAASPKARLVLPAALEDHAVSLGICGSRLHGIDAGESVDLAGFQIRAIPSAHEGLDKDASGRHLYLGFVIEAEGRRLYHSGDSMLYDGLVDHLGPEPFDVLFLPINGKDPARRVAGNMSAAEAVDLASIVKPRYLVPHHYDMFTFNTVPIDRFLDEARRLPDGVEPRVLRCAEFWEVRP
jgi:L-ascorbate metabolism protein UlaG (beta-lactamase superfamily)